VSHRHVAAEAATRLKSYLTLAPKIVVKHTNLGNFRTLGNDHAGNPGFQRLGRILAYYLFHFMAILSLSVASKGRCMSNGKKLSSLVLLVFRLCSVFHLKPHWM